MNIKNIFKPKQILFTVLIAAIGFSGCKKFLDVNQNPNFPDNAAPELLLPTTQAAVSQIVGNFFQINGNIWAQYWTQSPSSSQYKTIDQYIPTAASFDRPWLILYRNALANADLIIKNPGEKQEYLKGIAYLIKAYAFQLTTDAFGDIPLSQALQGNTYGSPKYDTQQSVYDSIFVYIDKGTALVSTASATSPGTQDMIFGGNMANWKAFANTLKLRAYLRIVKADPTKAQAGITALYATNPTFLTADATIKYTSTGGNENPLYNEIASPTLNKIQNVVASSTVVNAFTTNSDPRLAKFFDLFVDKTAPVDSVLSIPQGSYSAQSGKKVSPPSALTGARADNTASAVAPVKLISAAESYFLQAEAVARGYTTTSSSFDLISLFTKGTQASFTAVGAGDATTYLATAPDGLLALAAAGTVEAKVKAIITQKYYAMCGFQGFEAWNEWRRTGYPAFFVQSAASTIGAGKMPLRMIYPNSELTSNLKYPGTILIYNPVWWDKIH